MEFGKLIVLILRHRLGSVHVKEQKEGYLNIKYVCSVSKSAVLNSSPRAPPLCTFCMFLLSLQTFVLFERKCPAKWTSQDIPPWFLFEANVYVAFKVHWSVRDVNLICIYLQRYVMSHSSACEDVAQCQCWLELRTAGVSSTCDARGAVSICNLTVWLHLQSCSESHLTSISSFLFDKTIEDA